MVMTPALSPADVALLQEAVHEALELADERGLQLTPGQFVAAIFEAFWNGERDPARLAAAIIGPHLTFH
jgi:hypothetical protein